MISLSIHLYFNIHRTYYLFFKLHEIINKHVLAYVCYYSFCNEILVINVFFSKVQIYFKRYFTIYVILDFTPYEKNVSFQFFIFINNTYLYTNSLPFSAIFDIKYMYITGNNWLDTNCKISIINCNIYWNTWNSFFNGIR